MALARAQFDATNENGDILTNVSVEVRLASDNSLISLFSDRNGTVAISNPFLVVDGKVGFHVIGGSYNIVLTSGVYVRTLEYFGVGLSQELDLQFDHQGDFDILVEYTRDQIVTVSDSSWHKLNIATSTGDDPLALSGNWTQILKASNISFLANKKTIIDLDGVSEGIVSDQSAALTTALAGLNDGDYVDFQNKTIRLDAATQIPSGLILENVKFDITQTPANIYPLNLIGSLGVGVAVSTTLALGVYQITVADTTGYARGDVVFFVRSGFTAGSGFATNTVAETWWSEIDEVVNGTTVILREAYPHFYTIASSGLQMHKPTMMKNNRFHNVSGIRTDLETDFTHFFKADLAHTMFWEGGIIEGAFESGMTLLRSKNWRIRDIRTRGQAQEGYGYPIVPVDGCEDFWIESNIFGDCRHAVSCGGSGGIVRNGFIQDNIVRGARSAGLDVHPNADNITIKNNKIYLADRSRDEQVGGAYGNKEGITYQGANGKVIDNDIYGLSGSNTTSNNRSGVWYQALTRQPNDTLVIKGNNVTNIIGAGVIGYHIQNQKPAGNISIAKIDNNMCQLANEGSAGNLSPKGCVVTGHTLGTHIQRVTLDNNSFYSRSTALEIQSIGTKVITDITISGNYQIVNNDVPVINFNAGNAGYITRVSISGVNIRGGKYSIQNDGSRAHRIAINGAVLQEFATSAFSGGNIIEGNIKT